MKKKIKTVFIVSSSVLIFFCSGCEQFLENIDPPKSQISSEVVFTSDATATSTVVGMYLDMVDGKSFASGSNVSITALAGLSADELVDAPRTNYVSIEFEQNILGIENTYIYDNLWKSLFKTIYQANSIIEGLRNSSGLTKELNDQLEGEALFVRAFCNFYLINLFGDAPLVTSTDYVSNAKVSRTQVEIIYNKIVEDLLAAQELLHAEYTGRDASTGERIRPNKFTATALLARVYLYRGNWQAAEEHASQIINNTVVYGLTSLDSVFLMNSREAIWQLAPVRPNSNTNEGYYFVGERLQFNVLKGNIVSSFEPLDQRKLEWVGTGGAINFPHKYKQYSTSSTTPVTEYSMVFRLAEQILIRAEARAQQGNFTGANSAQSDLNMIRNRAGLPALNEVLSEVEVLAAIEQERRVELFTEWGHRWFDLKRWNRATEVLASVKSGWSETDVLYPIPQQEMIKNPNLLPQNPGY